MVPPTSLLHIFRTPSQKMHQLHTDSITVGVNTRQPPIHGPAFGAEMDTRWKRVLGRRYAAQSLLCVLAVCISSLMTQTSFPTAMIWGSAPYIGLIFSFATQFGPPGIPASQMYCSITAVMLLYLDKVATVLGKVAEPSFNNTGLQHHTVHFALAFFVLSELEYHRQYFATKSIKLDDFRNSPWLSLMPDADRMFNVCRQPNVYWYLLPCNERGEYVLERYGPLRLFLLDFISFILVGGCFNYVIMHMVNQSRTMENDFVFATGNVNVFFSTTNLWMIPLEVWVLTRFVRQANFRTVWGFLRGSARVLDWWNSNDTSSSDSRYLSTQDLETGYRLHFPSQTGEKV